MKPPRRPLLAVTAGDPAGIGPEIVARSLADGSLAAHGRVLVYAHPGLFDAECARAGVDPLPRGMESSQVAALSPASEAPVPTGFAFGQPTAFTGRVAADCVAAAARDAMAGRVDAVVTAPVSKAALRSAGVPHAGHTGLLAELCGAPSVAMMFVAGDLRVSLATVHIPLAEVPSALTVSGVLETLRLTREKVHAVLGGREPRIALLGVNPHAGEDGLLGPEETEVLEPVRAAAARKGWRVEGPYPADSYFRSGVTRHDAVLAMYHDQGLLPVKLLSGGRAVNVTLGLPFLRTSVDHGTAFDIAGRGTARTDSLLAASELAAEWTTLPVPG